MPPVVYPWLVLAAAVVLLLLLSYAVHQYFVDPRETYGLATAAVVLSFSVSMLCALLIPVDIYVISEGAIRSETLHVTVSQEQVRVAYMCLFASLLFLAFGLVPHAYFYGEERGCGLSGDVDRKMRGDICWSAMRSTMGFVGLIALLTVVSLNFRPGHVETVDQVLGGQEKAARWISDLLDAEHSGLNAMSFTIACLTVLGVLLWVPYTAYGMAAMPFAWLRGKQSAGEQREDVEQSIASVRDKYSAIQNRYPTREDGTLDLSRVKAADRKELNQLQREHKCLAQHNYRLQESEQKAGLVLPRVLHFLVPFRFAVGATMLTMSFLVVLSLLLTSLDRLLHSDCGMSCGYAIKEKTLFNPADEMFLLLARAFPMDFIVLAAFVLYIFAASVFGIISLGIRACCFSMYELKTRKSMPQALLVLCNVLAYIVLALCMAMLTIAPDYSSFGSQSATTDGGSKTRCSMERRESGRSCLPSVISVFFARISLAMPAFSMVYFFANWTFLVVFGCVFAYSAANSRRQPYLEDLPECEEEEMGLLAPA